MRQSKYAIHSVRHGPDLDLKKTQTKREDHIKIILVQFDLRLIATCLIEMILMQRQEKNQKPIGFHECLQLKAQQLQNSSQSVPKDNQTDGKMYFLISYN